MTHSNVSLDVSVLRGSSRAALPQVFWAHGTRLRASLSKLQVRHIEIVYACPVDRNGSAKPIPTRITFECAAREVARVCISRSSTCWRSYGSSAGVPHSFVSRLPTVPTRAGNKVRLNAEAVAIWVLPVPGPPHQNDVVRRSAHGQFRPALRGSHSQRVTAQGYAAERRAGHSLRPPRVAGMSSGDPADHPSYRTRRGKSNTFAFSSVPGEGTGIELKRPASSMT